MRRRFLATFFFLWLASCNSATQLPTATASLQATTAPTSTVAPSPSSTPEPTPISGGGNITLVGKEANNVIFASYDLQTRKEIVLASISTDIFETYKTDEVDQKTDYRFTTLSPDGTMAIVPSGMSYAVSSTFRINLGNQLYLVDLANQQTTSITNHPRDFINEPNYNIIHGEDSPAWSPDSKSLVFSTYSGLFLWEDVTDSSQTFELLVRRKDGERFYSVAWSPAGQFIALAKQSAEGNNLWLVDMGTRLSYQLTNTHFRYDFNHLQWTSNGNHLVWYEYSFDDYSFQIYTIAFQDGSVEEVTSGTFAGGFGFNYSLSPDGSWIAYVLNANLHILSFDGTINRHFPNFSSYYPPVWLPDSSGILFDNKVVDLYGEVIAEIPLHYSPVGWQLVASTTGP